MPIPAWLPWRRPKPSSGNSRDLILILTPVKDAMESLEVYFQQIVQLSYPHDRISFGFLESDSTDNTFADLQRRLPALRRRFRRADLWKKDFGYQLPAGIHRGAESIQIERRTVLAKSRNHLLFHALDDEDWVLWMDVDLVEYPRDIIERLLATGQNIVQPHCVLEYGGRTFDRNAWRDQGKLHIDDLRGEGKLVELHAVGGTMLLIRAELHRDGLIFPPFPYGCHNRRIRPGQPQEIETEGLGIMAGDMGHQCWAIPDLEILHRWA
jgi:hypothetical protein